MNLHVIPDDKFISRLIERIEAIGALPNNRFVVKVPGPFKYLKQPWLKGANPGSREFSDLTGDLSSYDKIFVHFMGDESLQWIVSNDLRNVFWMPWGADIYESMFGGFKPNDDLTEKVLQVTLRNKFNRSLVSTLNKFKQRSLYKNAYSRVGHICNWIYEEYAYAVKTLPGLQCDHRFFIYDVDVPFDQLAAQKIQEKEFDVNSLRVQLGQSITPAGNHASALNEFRKVKQIGEVVLPASYGSEVYSKQLQKWVAEEKFSFPVKFYVDYMPFDRFVSMLNTFDVLALNSIRPAGMGNFWIAILLGKAVLLRKENLAGKMLKELGLTFYYIDDWCRDVRLPSKEEIKNNREICLNFFAEARIANAYRNLFA